jgi:hypothetical protein
MSPGTRQAQCCSVVRPAFQMWRPTNRIMCTEPCNLLHAPGQSCHHLLPTVQQVASRVAKVDSDDVHRSVVFVMRAGV